MFDIEAEAFLRWPVGCQGKRMPVQLCRAYSSSLEQQHVTRALPLADYRTLLATQRPGLGVASIAADRSVMPLVSDCLLLCTPRIASGEPLAAFHDFRVSCLQNQVDSRRND
jgi:hypothetical protein